MGGMLTLTCSSCGSQLRKPSGATFNGKSLRDWWAQDCGSMCLTCRYSPQDPTTRPAGRPETLTAASDNAVQKAGARAGEVRAGTRRAMVLEAIQSAGQAGMTFDDLAQTLGMGYSNIGPRVRELRRDGYVTQAPFNRQALSGAMQQVWVAV